MFGRTPIMPSIAPSGRAQDHARLVQDAIDAERQYERQIGPWQRDVERDDERAAALKASYDEVLAHRFGILQRIDVARLEFDRSRAERERALVQSADPRIEDFLTWVDAEQDRLRTRIVRREIRRRDREGRTHVSPSSNIEAIRVVAESLTRARDAAQALRLRTVPDVGIALDAIRGTIPSLEDAEARVA